MVCEVGGGGGREERTSPEISEGASFFCRGFGGGPNKQTNNKAANASLHSVSLIVLLASA